MGMATPYRYKYVPQTDVVAVVCGGPSTSKYAKQAIQFINDNKATVFAANYTYADYGYNVDYTYITDRVKFFEVIDSLQSHVVLPKSMNQAYRRNKMYEAFGKNYREIMQSLLKKHREKGYAE